MIIYYIQNTEIIKCAFDSLRTSRQPSVEDQNWDGSSLAILGLIPRSSAVAHCAALIGF